MIHKTTAIFALACLSLHCAAQSDSTSHRVEHYFGLQANQLLRQILNFSNNSAPLNNPYLLNYSVVESKSKMGINVGLGYNFDQTKIGDVTNERETDINELFLRIGFEKKFSFGRKWLMGAGADFLFDNLNNETTSKTTNFGNSKSLIATVTHQRGLGFGPRCTLSYYISNRILLGTETTYYFKSLKNTGEIKSTITNKESDPNTGEVRDVTRSERTETDDKFKKLQLNAPAVIWLIVKF
jgi:hypothetical protein